MWPIGLMELSGWLTSSDVPKEGHSHCSAVGGARACRVPRSGAADTARRSEAWTAGVAQHPQDRPGSDHGRRIESHEGGRDARGERHREIVSHYDAAGASAVSISADGSGT